MEALDRITGTSAAILWAHWFILLLFIAIETAPVFVKLISPKGPYDNLLRIAEHGFIVEETESTARANAESKRRAETLPDQIGDHESPDQTKCNCADRIIKHGKQSVRRG